MKASDSPAFVATLIKAGCDICAVGDTRYVLGDVEETMAAHELECIGEAFGDRDSLIRESVVYLRSIGPYLDPGSPPSEIPECGRLPGKFRKLLVAPSNRDQVNA